MRIRTRLSLWYAAVMLASLSVMGALSYHEFVLERRAEPSQREPLSGRASKADCRNQTSVWTRHGARHARANRALDVLVEVAGGMASSPRWWPSSYASAFPRSSWRWRAAGG